MRSDPRSVLGPLAAAAAGTVLAAASPFRGASLGTTWLVDATERFAGWLGGGGSEAMRAAFSDPAGVLPLVPWVAAAASRALDIDPLAALRALAALAVGACAAATHVLARRIGGPNAAALAVAALVASPRFVAAATHLSPTIFALAATLCTVAAVLSARDHVRAAPLAVLVGALGLGTSLHVALATLPLAYLVLVRPEAPEATGHVSIRPTGLWMLALPAAWVALVAVASPYLHADTLPRLGRMLGVWLDRPGEPFLYRGALFGARRIPLTAPLVLWARTTPVTVVVAAVAGLTLLVARACRSSRVIEPRQLGVTLAIGVWVLPVVLRSPTHGGVDLLAFGATAVAIFAGVGLDAAAAALRRPLAGHAPALTRTSGGLAMAIALGLLAVGAADMAVSVRHPEAYASAVAGGPRSTARHGYARSAHAPIPPGLFVGLPSPCRIALHSNAWELGPIVGRYRAWGLIPADCSVADAATASVHVLVYDDTLPEFYAAVGDFEALAGSVSAATARAGVRSGLATIDTARVFGRALVIDGAPIVAWVASRP